MFQIKKKIYFKKKNEIKNMSARREFKNAIKNRVCKRIYLES